MEDQNSVRFNTYVRAVEQAKQRCDADGGEAAQAVLMTMVERLTGFVRSVPTKQACFAEKDALRCLTLIDGLADQLTDRVRPDADLLVDILSRGAVEALPPKRHIPAPEEKAVPQTGPMQIEEVLPDQQQPTPAARTVLLIEDDDIMGKHVSNQLMQFGYFVSWADSLDNVENILSGARPDCIIADIRIGDDKEAGTRFFDRLMEGGMSMPPIIYMSADTGFDSRLQALRAGGQAFVAKPYSTGELIEAVDSVLKIRQQEPVRFVLMDDNEFDLVNIGAALVELGGRIDTCRNPARILDVLSEIRPDVLVMSASMQQVGGIEVARVVRQDSRYVSLPIVILTDEGDSESQAEGLIQGSDSFLVKSVSARVLAAMLMGQAARARDISGLLFHDGLTGLLNHNAIKDRLVAEVSRGRRQNENVAMVLFDLDHFKSVNDQYGHPVGDQVLKSFSRLLSSRLRQSDSVGRYGGEEFAAVLPNTDAETAIAVIDKLRDAFSHVDHDSSKGSFNVTFSAGICMSFSSKDPDVMIKLADEALYEAKHDGRNQVKLWTAGD